MSKILKEIFKKRNQIVKSNTEKDEVIKSLETIAKHGGDADALLNQLEKDKPDLYKAIKEDMSEEKEDKKVEKKEVKEEKKDPEDKKETEEDREDRIMKKFKEALAEAKTEDKKPSEPAATYHD